MHGRFPELDGLRALAALTVFATHAAFLTGFTSSSAFGPLTARLNLGVALFFVLSGFLLYRPWVRARLADGPAPGLGGYALRRGLRIVPAYWVALLPLGLVIGDFVPGALGDRWWVYFGFGQVYGAETIVGGIAPAWSLGTEVAFYLVLPGFAWLTARLLRGRRHPVRLELVGLGASVVLALVLRELASRGDWLSTYDNTLPGRWPWFAVGLALAVLSVAPRRPRIGNPWAWWLAAAAALALSAVVLPREVLTMTARDQQVELLLFGMVAGCLTVPLVLGTGGPSRLLALRPAVWLGTVSYGLFLWHYPVIGWLQRRLGDAPAAAVSALSLLVALTLAAASWYAVERPLMRLGARRTRRPDRDAAPGAPVLEPAP